MLEIHERIINKDGSEIIALKLSTFPKTDLILLLVFYLYDQLFPKHAG